MKSENRLTYTVCEVAELLGLSRASAYQGIASGDIPHVRVGKRILIPVRSLEAKLSEAGKPRES